MMRNEIALDIEADRLDIPIIECNKPLQVLVAGRRFRKSTIARAKGIVTAFKKPGAEIVYISRTYRRSIREFKLIMRLLRDHVVSHQRQPPPELELRNGSRWSFFSFDRPDNLRGDPADLVIGDEAALLDGEAFWEAVQPMTAERDGQILLTSTVRSNTNWFWQEYRKALSSPDAACWLYPTSEGLLFRGKKGRERLERIKRQIPDRVWKMEYCCEPSTDEDRQVFRFLDDAIVSTIPPTTPQAGHFYALALDVGSVVDNSAALVLDATSGAVVAIKLFPLGLRHEQIAKETAALAKHWRAFVVADATGGFGTGGRHDPYAKLYEAFMPGLKAFYFSGNSGDSSKRHLIHHLEGELQFARITIPESFKPLIEQLRAYEYRHHGDTVTYSAPAGQHDDFVAALAMASWAKHKSWIPTRPGTSLAELTH